MAKNILFMVFVLSGFITLADNNIILKIGDNTITEDNIKLEKTVITNLFERKYKRLPNAGDQKLFNAVEFEWKQKKLMLLLCKIIKKNIKSKYYDKVVTQDVINQYIIEHRKNVKEDITLYTMFLDAADYIKKSTEKDKYRIAYDKYRKLGMGNSYNFFKSAVDNKAYLEQLKVRIKNLSDNALSDGDKDMIFNQKLPDYIVNELSEKDGEIKEHLQLAKKHVCNYKDLLYEKWFAEQGEQIGVEIFDVQYGNSLNNILNPRNKPENSSEE